MEIGNMKVVGSQQIKMGNGEDGWRVDLEVQVSGEPRIIPHFFPESCFGFRAAEYGIDITDMDTLLDIILTENHIPNEEVDPDLTVYGKASQADTRQAHLNRCARVKLRHRMSTRPNSSTLRARAANPDDPMTAEQAEAAHPLALIRSHYKDNPISQADVKACKAAVHEQMDRLGIERTSE